MSSDGTYVVAAGCMTEAFNIICAVHHLEKILRMGGCPVVVTHWQNTGTSS